MESHILTSWFLFDQVVSTCDNFAGTLGTIHYKCHPVMLPVLSGSILPFADTQFMHLMPCATSIWQYQVPGTIPGMSPSTSTVLERWSSTKFFLITRQTIIQRARSFGLSKLSDVWSRTTSLWNVRDAQTSFDLRRRGNERFDIILVFLLHTMVSQFPFFRFPNREACRHILTTV